MRARWTTRKPIVQLLAGLVATITVMIVVTVTAPTSSVAAAVGTVVFPDTSLATEAILTTTRRAYPPAGAVRTQAQLLVPIGAHWDTEVRQGSVLLTVAAGSLEVTIDAGTARSSHHAAPEVFHDLTPGESVVLSARDRLVLHGPGTILTQNITQDAVIAAVIRIE